jgi:hypothetical protein
MTIIILKLIVFVCQLEFLFLQQQNSVLWMYFFKPGLGIFQVS